MRSFVWMNLGIDTEDYYGQYSYNLKEKVKITQCIIPKWLQEATLE